jgi:ABC-type glycerol-3-phosphate transport system permease component
MAKFFSLLCHSKNQLLIHALLILLCVISLFPIVVTVIISFKLQQDITRNPPVLLPCDTKTIL